MSFHAMDLVVCVNPSSSSWVWVSECFFWYLLTWVISYKGPWNGCLSGLSASHFTMFLSVQNYLNLVSDVDCVFWLQNVRTCEGVVNTTALISSICGVDFAGQLTFARACILLGHHAVKLQTQQTVWGQGPWISFLTTTTTTATPV